MIAELRDRFDAVVDSVRFQDHGLAGVQFVRYAIYLDLRRILRGLNLRNPDVLEIGHSNGVIVSFLDPNTVVTTGDYPATDVCQMPQVQSRAYDVVVLDQVLEHVQAPERAVAEVHRVLRPGGYAVIATPFFIKIHGYPDDYWRFTAHGLERLLAAFRDVHTGQWGNRFTLKMTMRHGWLTTWQTRRKLAILLKNEPEWPIVMWAVCRK